jgi:hypothetical protein
MKKLKQRRFPKHKDLIHHAVKKACQRNDKKSREHAKFIEEHKLELIMGGHVQ